MIRGGAWKTFARSCRAASRGDAEPGVRDNDLGFRLVLLPGQPRVSPPGSTGGGDSSTEGPPAVGPQSVEAPLSALGNLALHPIEETEARPDIRLHLLADKKLNFDGGSPHTLLLCAYQLRDLSIFTQLSENADGIYKLLEGDRFDKSVLAVKRLILYPGQDQNLTLPAADKARYLAVAAGYYELKKEFTIRVYEIPDTTNGKADTRVSPGAKSEALAITLRLGPSNSP